MAVSNWHKAGSPDHSGATTLTIRLVPALSATALKQGKTNELALWHCLRAINHWGSSMLDVEMAIEQLINVFHYSRRTAYRHLAQGEGCFWHRYTQKGRSVLAIEGLNNVAEYLTTPVYGDRHFRNIEPGEFRSLKQRRAQLYASIHKPEGIIANPISRQSIEESTGLHKVQQRRYEKASRVHRTPTYAMYGLGNTFLPQKQLIVTREKQYYVNKRLGNIYHSKQEPGSKGMLRKVSYRRNEGSLILAEAPMSQLKRFFPRLKQLLMAWRTRASDAHYRVPQSKTSIRGRVEWCILETI